MSGRTPPELRAKRKGKTMSDEQELLAKGWERTRGSMALIGMSIPDCIHFQMDGRRQIPATRIAR
jgi:hypothetical protein